MPLVEMSKAELAIYSLCTDTKAPTPMIEFDLNAFRDPLGNHSLRKACSNGQDPLVQEWIKVDPRFEAILNQCIILVKDHFYDSANKWLALGFRDHHGTWKSQAVACLISTELANLGYKVGVIHARGQE